MAGFIAQMSFAPSALVSIEVRVAPLELLGLPKLRPSHRGSDVATRWQG